ncbi:SKP1-like protein 21 [Trifolium pratense]|uniref:SKP1-like protein 21 n=1 Tax=Trifolium pratense TaxID=57577 RepID=UPI001E69122F|nr:SKP1-like protein 21 [Trifolium pratense]
MLETEMMKPYLWLQTGDDSIQQVEQEVALVCPFICQEFKLQKGIGSSKNRPICLPEQVRNPALLNLILSYCRFHLTPGHSNKERKSYDEKFVKIMNTNSLSELVGAVHSLRLRPLINLTCSALARRIEDSSPEEIHQMFCAPEDLMEEEKLESFSNVTCDARVRLLNLYFDKRRELREPERILHDLQLQHTNVVDERPVDELLSFINGSNDEEPKPNKTRKNKKKNQRKEKQQQKKSSLKEAPIQHNKKEEDDPKVEFNDEEFDQTIMAKIDKEVEEFARRLNTEWSERIKEFFERC